MSMTESFHSPREENIIRAFSTHWIKYVAPTLAFVIVISASIAMLVAAGLSANSSTLLSHTLLFLGLVLTYLSLHWYFHKLLSEAMEDIVITSKRIIWIREALFAVDEMRQIPLANIQGVEARKRGILQTVLGYGTLWLDTGGTITADANAIIDQVPHPNRVAGEINKLLRLK